MKCELCGGSGLQMEYSLRPVRPSPGGQTIIGPARPLTREQFEDLRQRGLPSSVLEWRPGAEGWISESARICQCRIDAARRDKEKPARRRHATKGGQEA
jgi:hypothetical protein